MRLRFFLIVTVAVLLTWGTPAAAQCVAGGDPTCTTRTTLSANVDDSQTTISVASATDFTVGNKVWVDYELMHILSVTGTTIGVRRGDNGTRAAAHDNGDAVFTGVGTGGPRGGGHFNTQDPRFGEDCTRGAGEATHLPWINIRTGWMWTCDNGTTTDWSATSKAPQTVNSEPEQF